MKKTNLLTAVTLCTALAFTSCSKSDSEECHPCHIAETVNGSEIEFDLNGGALFCGNEISNLESNGFTVSDTLYSESGDTLLPGFYDANVVHCEEHADEE